LELNQHKYKIPHWIFYAGILVFGTGILLCMCYRPTLTDIHKYISSILNSEKVIAILIIVLVFVGIVHAILHSWKKNIDSFGKKSVMDFYIWITSTMTVIGTGFLAYTSLKIFNGLLGEKVANIQFLFSNEDPLILWPFMIITFVAVIYCAIKIGSMIGEIIDMCKVFFHYNEEKPEVHN